MADIFFISSGNGVCCHVLHEHLADFCGFRIFQTVESCAVNYKNWKSRPHSVSITEFGAVGDGKTLNTHAFENAMFYLRTYADKGGVQLYIPAGRWLTGSIKLISHLTLFLENEATILGSQVGYSIQNTSHGNGHQAVTMNLFA